jgi:hypothetical protein
MEGSNSGLDSLQGIFTHKLVLDKASLSVMLREQEDIQCFVFIVEW